MLETGFELLANFPRTQSSCLLESWGYAQGNRERLFARRRKYTQYTVPFTTFRVPFTVLRYGGAEFWCFLLADLSVAHLSFFAGIHRLPEGRLLGLLVSKFKRGGVNWACKIFARTHNFSVSQRQKEQIVFTWNRLILQSSIGTIWILFTVKLWSTENQNRTRSA